MSSFATHAFIVDDDQSFGKSLKRLLNTREIATDYFRSAQSFLDSVTPGQPGWAIVDIHMPDFDGFALMDKMNDLRYVMSVIMITGQAQSDDRDLAMKKGAKGFLQKPFSEESLLEIFSKG